LQHAFSLYHFYASLHCSVTNVHFKQELSPPPYKVLIVVNMMIVDF